MAETQQPAEEFPPEGECDAKMYDDLSQYVASPRFLSAFEASSVPEASGERVSLPPGSAVLETHPLAYPSASLAQALQPPGSAYSDLDA